MAEKQKRCYQFLTDGGPVEAGGTFFAFRAGDVDGIFQACRYRGIRGCPLTSVKRNAFYESGKNCTRDFWQKLYTGFLGAFIAA